MRMDLHDVALSSSVENDLSPKLTRDGFSTQSQGRVLRDTSVCIKDQVTQVRNVNVVVPQKTQLRKTLGTGRHAYPTFKPG